MFFDQTSAVSSDGVLQVNRGDKLTATYLDPADDFGNANTITANSFYGMTAVASGALSGNTTWTKANSPYLLTGDVMVPDSVTLTIDPGVVVRFKAVSDDLSGGDDINRIEIRVSGTLNARGTVSDSIHFTSNSQIPSSGDWYGFVSYDESSSSWQKVGKINLSYASIRHYIRGVSFKNY